MLFGCQKVQIALIHKSGGVQCEHSPVSEPGTEPCSCTQLHFRLGRLEEGMSPLPQTWAQTPHIQVLFPQIRWDLWFLLFFGKHFPPSHSVHRNGI